MSVISERVANDRAKFISYREAVEKLAAATGESISDCATALRASKIHFTGGARFKAGIFIDGGFEEEPLGFLLEQTATTGAIPLCWDIRQEFGPDNIGWRREALLRNLESTGLPVPESLLSTSPEYAPRPPEAQPLALDEQRPEAAPAATLDPPSANEAPVARTETPDDYDELLSRLFDPVKKEQLEAYFPDGGKWTAYAEKAARNGLLVARVGRGKFNPYLAAIWWLNEKGPDNWKWERCVRVLANNLPPRSIGSRHLLTGDFD